MFYGIYCDQLSNNSGSIIHPLSNLMNFDHCINHKIKFVKFNGGIFIHKNLPYVVDDFVYLILLMNYLLYYPEQFIIKLLSVNNKL
jgi:hypothetical protein